MRMVNLGCGKNKLKGWENYDIDVDICKPLPFDDGSINFIFAEHVIEHISSHEVWNFFEECYRSLVSGGVVRIVTPSIVKAYDMRDDNNIDELLAYYKKRKWSDGTIGNSIKSLLFCHEHKSLWTIDLLRSIFYSIGFDSYECELYKSNYDKLNNIEGHWRVTGRYVNDVHSICMEATKDGLGI